MAPFFPLNNIMIMISIKVIYFFSETYHLITVSDDCIMMMIFVVIHIISNSIANIILELFHFQLIWIWPLKGDFLSKVIPCTR